MVLRALPQAASTEATLAGGAGSIFAAGSASMTRSAESDRWRQIVDNLAALVATLDRSFVPEIEAISGASPEWFRPETA